MYYSLAAGVDFEKFNINLARVLFCGRYSIDNINPVYEMNNLFENRQHT